MMTTVVLVSGGMDSVVALYRSRQGSRVAACVERREAFLLAGIPDPTDYLTEGPLPQKPRSAPGGSGRPGAIA